MYRELEIDGVKTPMEANGFTPIVYKHVFSRSIFKDFEAVNVKSEDGEQTETDLIAAIEIAGRLAYVMHGQTEDFRKLSYDGYVEYMRGLSPMAISNATGEIMELYTDNTKTDTTSKKK